MGKEEVEDLLEKKKKWMSARDLYPPLDMTIGNIHRALSRLSKSNEVKERKVIKKLLLRNGKTMIREITQFKSK